MKRTLTLTMTALALTTSVAAQEAMVAYPVSQAPLDQRANRGAGGGRVAHYHRRAVLGRGRHRVAPGAERRQPHRSQDHDARLSGQRGAHPSRAVDEHGNRAERDDQRPGRRIDVRAESGRADRPSQRRDHGGRGWRFGVASVAPGSSGTVTAARTADGGVRVSASEPNEAGRRRETEAQVAGGSSAGVAVGA